MSEPTTAQTDPTKELPLGAKLAVEWMRIKKDAADPNDKGKRIVSSRGKVRWRGEKFTFIQRGRRFFFIDTEALIWEPAKGRRRGYWKIQFDEHLCEPLKNGATYRSKIVSMILRDEVMAQLITIAQNILPIQITRTMTITTTVFSILAGLFVLGIAPSVAPQTVVHWVTQAPKVVP